VSKRKSSVGCLGCFWFFGLILFTACEGAALWWLNPLWLDEYAFWRGEVYGPDSLYLAATEAELVELEPPPPPPEERVVLWNELAVETRYDPTTGATLETVEGARFDFVSGSIDGATSVEIVPVRELPVEMMQERGIVPHGPLHDVRVGGAEHHDFEAGVPVTFRFDPEGIPAELADARIAVGTWQDGHWVELPSRVDVQAGTAQATLDHASVMGILLVGGKLSVEGAIAIYGTLSVGSFGRFTSTGQSLVQAMTSSLPDTYETKNFSIHYATEDPIGVPRDDEYPDARGRASSDAPLFVQDVGVYLEEALAGLHEVGIPARGGMLLRHDVFLPPSADFGSSGLGGPLYLDNDFRNPDTRVFPADFTYRLRVTCAHELIHVAQDDYFHTFNATAARWWIEATAEFLANRFMDLRGQELVGVDYYVDDYPHLLEKPWDRSQGNASYAWARFLDWLGEEKGVDAIALVQRVNEAGASLAAVDTALRDAGHDGLSSSFEEFAEAFHHENLWTEAFTDLARVEEDAHNLTAFNHLTYVPKAGGGRRLVHYAERTFPQLHLSASHVLFQAASFPADARAKVVVHLPGAERSSTHLFAYAAGLDDVGLPLTGAPSSLDPVVDSDGAGGLCWVSDRLGDPAAVPDGVQQVSFLLGNGSVTEDGPEQAVRRWLLMPPANVVYHRATGGGPYEVTWQEAELATKAKHGEFAGYNVYRRARGDSTFPDEPINPAPLTATTFSDTPPSGQDCAYTVTVVDRLGNESLPANVSDHDAFQGTWRGKLLLIEGELVTPIQRWMDETKAEDEAAFQRELAATSDSAAKARLRESYERSHANDLEFEKAVIPALEKLMAAFRLGVPIELEITLRDGEYVTQVTKVMMTAIDPSESPKIPMTLLGPHTIAPKDLPPELSMVTLPLHRANEINHVWRFELETKHGPLAYGIRLDLKRER